MSFTRRIDCWDDIPGAISDMQRAGAGHRVPLLQALYQGRIAHLETQRSASPKLLKLWCAKVRLPAVLLLGDDDHMFPFGPGTWPFAARAIRWARFIVIHGASDQPDHYEQAIALAEQFGRLLLVECPSTGIEAWERAADRFNQSAHRLVLRPPSGSVHPTLAGRGLQ